MRTVETDVVVVGAGIAGLAAAFELARTGTDVVVVEQFSLGHDRGSSHGASRIFRLSYPTPEWVMLAHTAAEGWRRYESELGEPLLRRTGSLDVGSYAQANHAALEECDAEAELLEPEATRERWGLDLPRGTILFQPDAGVLSAALALELLAGATVSTGGSIVPRRRVERLEPAGGSVRIHTAEGTIVARSAVVTAGAWARGLLAPLGIVLPVVVTRETVAFVDAGPVDDLPTLVFAALPGAPDGSSGRDIATYALAEDPSTLKVGVHHTGPEADPDESGDPDPATAGWAAEFVGECLPDRPGRLLESQTCLYTNTTDERFVLERHGRIVVGSACSGHGFKFGPVIGDTLARLAGEAATDT